MNNYVETNFFLHPGRRWMQLFRMTFWLFFIYILLSSSFGTAGANVIWIILLIVFFTIAALYDLCRFINWNKPFIVYTQNQITIRTFLGFKEKKISFDKLIQINIKKRLNNTPLILLHFRTATSSRQHTHAIWVSDYSDKKSLLSLFTRIAEDLE